MRLRHLTLFLLAFILASRGVAVPAQSLADVARQEEERRKTVKENGKRYTNKDLKEVPPPPAGPPASSETAKDSQPDTTKATEAGKDQATKDQASKGTDNEKQVPKDQTYWSGRMKELRAKLERDQVYADALQSRVNALTTDFVNRDNPVERGAIAADRDKAISVLGRLKKAVVDDQKAIADLEEEARRAGAPPGWLR